MRVCVYVCVCVCRCVCVIYQYIIIYHYTIRFFNVLVATIPGSIKLVSYEDNCRITTLRIFVCRYKTINCLETSVSNNLYTSIRICT